MTHTTTDLSYTYSPGFPALFWELECSLIISTYQSGKVVFISAKDRETLTHQSYEFSRPMGVAVSDSRIAVATREEILVFARSGDEDRLPPLPRGEVQGGSPFGKGGKRRVGSPPPEETTPTSDTNTVVSTSPLVRGRAFAPETAYVTGDVDIHDLVWGEDGLWAVNTLYSTLARMDETPPDLGAGGRLGPPTPKSGGEWRPPFISDLKPQDRCHLNGIATIDGRPQYATALGETDTEEGWRKRKTTGGALIEIASGETVVGGLSMPHSPRLHDGKLYMLLSATGEVICVDEKRGTYEIITRLPGFARGLACYGDYLFVGLSKIRETSSTFKDLPVAEVSTVSGVTVVGRHDGSVLEQLRFETGCEELYDVQVWPGLQPPQLMMRDTSQFVR